MYGYDAAAIVGRPISLLVPPERGGDVSAILAQLKRGERLENHETVRRRKDGTRVDVSLNFSPMRDESGRVTGWLMISRDITAWKRGERRLAAEHSVTRALAESTNLEDAAPKVLRTVGETLGCDLGVLWKVGLAPGVLRCVAVWHPPGIAATEFEQHSGRIAFAAARACRGGPGTPVSRPGSRRRRSPVRWRRGETGRAAPWPSLCAATATSWASSSSSAPSSSRSQKRCWP